MDDRTKEWIQYAENDFGVARHLYKTYYPKPLEIICYHCQQSAEKAIKALIIYHGAEGGLPKKHNLSFLLSQIKNMENIPDKYYDYADILTPYGIAAKYPNELFLEDRHAEQALRFSQEILDWVKSIVNEQKKGE